MEKVIVYKDEFENQINDLIDILIFKKYFSFEEDAVNYTEKIYDFIYQNIEKPLSRISPKKFKKYGKKFLKYKANHQTYWYIFFDQNDNKFLVNYILNSNSNDFPELI